MSKTKSRLISDREIIKRFREETGYRGKSWRSTICPDPVKWPKKTRSLKKKGEDVIVLDFDWIEGEEENFLQPKEADQLIESLSDWYEKLKVRRKEKDEKKEKVKEIEKIASTVKEGLEINTTGVITVPKPPKEEPEVVTVPPRPAPPPPPYVEPEEPKLPRPEKPEAPPPPPKPSKEREEEQRKKSEEYYKKVRQRHEKPKEKFIVRLFNLFLKFLGLK